MRSQKLFALQGEVRGAARLVYGDMGGTLAVELVPREADGYEAWLIAGRGPVFHALLGPAMTASVPANLPDAAGVFISRAGRIIASGNSGLPRADMEAAALRVQLALAESAKIPREAAGTEAPPRAADAGTNANAAVKPEATADAKPAANAAAAPAHKTPPAAGRKNTIPAHTVAKTPFSVPSVQAPVESRDAHAARVLRDAHAARVLREAHAGPAVKSEAALSIVSTANRLFNPREAEESQNAFVQGRAPVQKPSQQGAGPGMKRNMANARQPMQPARKNAPVPPFGPPRSKGPRNRSGRPR